MDREHVQVRTSTWRDRVSHQPLVTAHFVFTVNIHVSTAHCSALDKSGATQLRDRAEIQTTTLGDEDDFTRTAGY